MRQITGWTKSGVEWYTGSKVSKMVEKLKWVLEKFENLGETSFGCFWIFHRTGKGNWIKNTSYWMTVPNDQQSPAAACAKSTQDAPVSRHGGKNREFAFTHCLSKIAMKKWPLQRWFIYQKYSNMSIFRVYLKFAQNWAFKKLKKISTNRKVKGLLFWLWSDMAWYSKNGKTFEDPRQVQSPAGMPNAQASVVTSVPSERQRTN